MPSNVSVSVKQAIESAMKVNKKDRPQSVEVFLNLFDKKKSAPQPSPSPKNVRQNDEETRVLQKESQQPAALNGYHKKKFDDGSVYEGNFVNGKPEGKGIMKYVGGASYIGEWHYGLREGEGTWNYPDGGSYIGSWVRGRRHGRGTLNKKGGMVIIGEWKNDRLVAELGVKEKEAKATLEKPGSFGKALFKGLLIAAAIIIPIMLIPIGITQCQNNSPNYTLALDTMAICYEDTVVVADTIAADTVCAYTLLNGYHTETYSDGKYEGDFKDGKRHGQGTYTWNNGDKYTGEWKDGKLNGYGTFTWKETRVGYMYKYEGYFVNDQRHGKGTAYFVGGDTYSGNWKNGDRTGYGTYTWKDGGKYEGYFVNGKLHGNGTMYYNNYTYQKGT